MRILGLIAMLLCVAGPALAADGIPVATPPTTGTGGNGGGGGAVGASEPLTLLLSGLALGGAALLKRSKK